MNDGLLNEIAMKCVLCKHGETRSGKVTVTLQREETLVIIKQVPADVCEKCGEYYLSESLGAWVLEKAEEAVRKGAKEEVLRYAA